MADCEQPAQPETDFIFTGAAGQYGIGGCDTPIGCMALRHGNPATKQDIAARRPLRDKGPSATKLRRRPGLSMIRT
jgi:hypothetical protein